VSSKQKLFGITLVALVGLMVGSGTSQTSEPALPGIYSLIEVNGEKLPAVSWTSESNGKHCNTETLGGALLLDSEGQWASLVTERDVCLHDDGSETAHEEVSSMFMGSYESSGNQINAARWGLGGPSRSNRRSFGPHGCWGRRVRGTDHRVRSSTRLARLSNWLLQQTRPLVMPAASGALSS